MPAWLIILIICVVASVYLFALIYYVYTLINKILWKNKRKKFLHDFNKFLIVIQKKNLSIEKSINQIKTDFSQLSGIFEENDLSSTIRFTLNELILLYDTQPNNQIILSDEIDSQVIRDYAWEIYDYLNDNEPYAELQIKEANLFYSLKSLLNEDNKEIGMKTLRQLADEIQLKDEVIQKKERHNKIACIISIIGIVLTAVFGVFSILSLFL